MPEKYGELSIENCVLTSGTGEMFDWPEVKDVTTELEDISGSDKGKILFDNNLECTFKIETGPRFRKMLDRLQFCWKARGPIRKKLWWRLVRKYKFSYYIS